MITILRGLPGSGKSTLAKSSVPGTIICSADDYHMVDGKYLYDAKNASAAHTACLKQFLANLECPNLIVDNTNISAWELAPYVALAKLSNQSWEILLVNASLEICLSHNTHNVPHGTILDMQRRLLTEFIPWPQRIV